MGGGYLTCVVAVMFVFAAITSNGLNERGLITAGCSFLYLLIMMGLIVRAGFKAKKEQLHYYQAKGIEPLSIEKLQALQLIAPYRFYHKQWSETLESGRESLNLAKIPSNIMCFLLTRSIS